MILDSSIHNHAGNTSQYRRDGAPHNWEALKAGGVIAAAVRLTVGRYYVDPWGDYDFKAGQDAGVPMTFYHVGVPGQEPAAQVDNFLRAAGACLPDWAVVFDWEIQNEFYGPANTAIGQACYDYHIANLPRVHSIGAGCYTNQNVGNLVRNHRNAWLWVASPGEGGSYNPAPAPSLPRPWVIAPPVVWSEPLDNPPYVIWQRSWKHGYPGIVDPTCDMSEYNGELEEFRVRFRLDVPGQEPPPGSEDYYAVTKAGYNIRSLPIIEDHTDIGNAEGGKWVHVVGSSGDFLKVEAWIHEGGLDA